MRGAGGCCCRVLWGCCLWCRVCAGVCNVLPVVVVSAVAVLPLAVPVASG